MQAQGHPGMAYWMFMQAHEEEEHAFRLLEWLTLKGHKHVWGSIPEAHQKVYAHCSFHSRELIDLDFRPLSLHSRHLLLMRSILLKRLKK